MFFKRCKIYMSNVLKQYKEDTCQLWDEISEITGISRVTLIKISKASGNEILLLNLNTYYLLKDRLGIDILENLWEKK